ncbi:MAG: hypothetical protein LBB23_01890 [Rickettsiales bacterium]|nr:hypothetical protein [Rickettsiales bacterium]
MSRIMGFALAAQLVVIFVLWATLDGLFPLVKKQVFFAAESERYIAVAPYYPDAKNLELFKQNFIRQYVVERLSVYPSSRTMSRRWGMTGRVRAWSTSEVFREFSAEPLTKEVLAAEPFWTTRIVFLENPTPRGQDRYAIRVRKIKELVAGHTTQEEATIILKLHFEDSRNIRWNDRLDNPFGVQVADYRIENLDTATEEHSSNDES